VSYVELQGLTKRYPDGTLAVAGVDLAIAAGEFVVLLGPSGCGKTTTLRMLAGLELPSSGTIRLAGRDVTRLSASERDIGFVFQFYALYPHLSVAENIAFPLECAGVPRAERNRRVQALAKELDLLPLLATKPRRLSGGDQQRVALARALVRRPALFLMDEPLGTLDAAKRLELCELIKEEQRALGVATVYVTHDQEEALRLADRVVVMQAGKIVQAASPAETYAAPATLFVADFVGSPGMNRIAGLVASDGRTFRAAGTSASAESGIELSRAVAPGAAVLGVRPENLHVDPAGPWRGRVVHDEFLGADRCLYVDTPAGRLVLRVAPNGQGGRSAVGTELGLRPGPAGLLLYDPASGALVL
jgi:multiple sugar transport system ATP-binding protein